MFIAELCFKLLKSMVFEDMEDLILSYLKVLVLWHHNFKISNINMRNIGCYDHINKCNLFGITMTYEASIMLNITHLFEFM